MSDFFGAWVYRKARKTHICSLCFRTIDKGETYGIQNNHFDDRWYSFRWCEHCRAIWNLYHPEDYDTGGMSEDSYQAWRDEGEFGPSHPKYIEELRHRAMFRAHWRYKSGALMPVPFFDYAADLAARYPDLIS